MKFKRVLLIVLCLSIFLQLACKKNNDNPSEVASLTIVNASTQGEPLKVNFTDLKDIFLSIDREIPLNSYAVFTVPAKVVVPIDVRKKADLTKPLFFGKREFEAGGIYSLFIFGDIGSPDSLFVHEKIPTRNDDTMGIRIINLSEDAKKISVKIGRYDYNGVSVSTTPLDISFPYLSYKTSTDFEVVPVFYEASFLAYTLEILDESSGEKITAFLSRKINKNITCVITGAVSTGLRTLIIDNF